MKWTDLPLNPTDKALRQFAGAWLVFLLAWGGYVGMAKGHPGAGALLAALAVGGGAVGLWRPRTLRWLYVGAMLVAFPIGWVVSQVMLAVMYYGVMTPVALWFRWRGRDVLRRKPARDQSTFWVAKSTPSDVRSYLRQY